MTWSDHIDIQASEGLKRFEDLPAIRKYNIGVIFGRLLMDNLPTDLIIKTLVRSDMLSKASLAEAASPPEHRWP